MTISLVLRRAWMPLGIMALAACSDPVEPLTVPTPPIAAPSSPVATKFRGGIIFPAPPTCHRDIRAVEWKRGVYAHYEFAFEYRGSRLAGPPPPSAPRGSYLYQRIYVYHVQNVIYPWGLVSAGRAEKVCGTMIAQG